MLNINDIKNDREVVSIMTKSAEQIEALGFTEHSVRHSSIVSKRSGEILKKIGAPEERVKLAEIAGYLHDIGNCVCREAHAQSGAILAYQILTRMGMPYNDAGDVMMAIGNHDEKFGLPVSDISAALIIADKSDVHKSRVRKNVTTASLSGEQNIHDRVNIAAEKSYLTVDREKNEIVLTLEIDISVCPVMDYFQIYFNRMKLCRTAANFLGYHFGIIINDARLL